MTIHLSRRASKSSIWSALRPDRLQWIVAKNQLPSSNLLLIFGEKILKIRALTCPGGFRLYGITMPLGSALLLISLEDNGSNGKTTW